MIWLFCAALTLLVLALLVWPVLRGERDGDAADRSAYDRTVFRDQLAELERDLSRGLIGEKEAEAARNEISRRLIAAAEQGGGTHGRRLPLAIAMATVLIVPAVAVPLYLKVGNPALPDVPLQARIDRAAESGDFDALIAKVERHLAGAPGDVQGWQVLAQPVQRQPIVCVNAGHAQHRGAQPAAHEVFGVKSPHGTFAGGFQARRFVDPSTAMIAVDTARTDVDGTARNSVERSDEMPRAPVAFSEIAGRGEVDDALCQTLQATQGCRLIQVADDRQHAGGAQQRGALRGRRQRDESEARGEA